MESLVTTGLGLAIIALQWAWNVVYNNFFEIVIVFLLLIIAENTSR